MEANKWTSSKNPSHTLKDEENKIQLLHCPHGGLNCKSHLAEINRLFIDSQNHQQNKEFQFSIQALKSAFEETFELQASTCINCANVFRSEIIDSLKNMHEELERMSRGIFRKKKRYATSIVMVRNTISELSEKLKDIKEVNQENKNKKFGA